MINKIINALKQNSLLIETANLEQLQNWQGKYKPIPENCNQVIFLSVLKAQIMMA